MKMLSLEEIAEMRAAARQEETLSRDSVRRVLGALLNRALDEIEAQRPVVLAALECTGEDGHDMVASLCDAAETYKAGLE